MFNEEENLKEETTPQEEAARETEAAEPLETAAEPETEAAAEEQSGDSEGEAASDEEAPDGGEPEAAKEAEATEETDGEDDGKGRKRLSRRDRKALEKKDEEIAAVTDQWKRTMAEFDNYRKRTEKEKAAMYGMGAKDVIEKVLPVVDNFERGFSLVSEEDKADAFVQGMEAIYKQFMTVLDGLGVKPIEAVGQPFDPAFHNAVMHVDDESVGDNIIVEEFQKGYMYQDTVVRFSMVKVAN